MDIISQVAGKKIQSLCSHSVMVQAAHWYHGLGFNALPLKDPSKTATKQPSIRWKYGPDGDFSKEEFTSDLIDDAADEDSDFGMPGYTHGIIAVTGINNYRSIDIDKIQDFSVIDEILTELGLPLDYTWVIISGSQRGAQIWVTCNDEDEELIEMGFPQGGKDEYGDIRAKGCYMLPAINYARFDHVELRWNGVCAVLPPSIHPSGNFYNFRGDVRPTDPPARVWAYKIARALLRIAKAPEDPNKKGAEAYDDNNPPVNIGVEDEKPYAQGALRNMCAEISQQKEGNRSNLLIARACKLYEYVNSGCLNRDHVFEALLEAGEACGLPTKQVMDTLKSAERRVGNKKRDVPLQNSTKFFSNPMKTLSPVTQKMKIVKAPEYKVVKDVRR